MRARLFRTQTATYTYSDKYGEKENYDIQGRLVTIVSSAGNSLVFTYSATTKDSLWGLLPSNVDQNNPLIVAYDYRLSKIEEKRNRGSYRQMDHICTTILPPAGSTDIVDSIGRTVTYTHDNIGNLTRVRGPNGSATYSYNGCE